MSRPSLGLSAGSSMILSDLGPPREGCCAGTSSFCRTRAETLSIPSLYTSTFLWSVPRRSLFPRRVRDASCPTSASQAVCLLEHDTLSSIGSALRLGLNHSRFLGRRILRVHDESEFHEIFGPVMDLRPKMVLWVSRGTGPIPVPGVSAFIQRQSRRSHKSLSGTPPGRPLLWRLTRFLWVRSS